jgi:hypothetical protein
VAFEESWESLELEDHSSSSLSLTKMANDVTYRRLLRSLDRISSMGSHLLANILLGIRQRRLLLPPSPEQYFGSGFRIRTLLLNKGLLH